jgi:hypothetical protein
MENPEIDRTPDIPDDLDTLLNMFSKGDEETRQAMEDALSKGGIVDFSNLGVYVKRVNGINVLFNGQTGEEVPKRANS